MADTKIALDYLNTLFEKLAAGDLDPAHVDWPFAAEAWQAVRVMEIEQGFAFRELLREALAESLKLQSHYAKLLNMHDGGQRMIFNSERAWLNRLRELRETNTSSVDIGPQDD